MAAKTKKDEKTLVYRGKTLIRSGNTIYYGNTSDPFVACLQCMDAQEFSDMTLPGKVTIQILATDENLSPKDRVKKKTEKNSLYEALNIASIWLERVE